MNLQILFFCEGPQIHFLLKIRYFTSQATIGNIIILLFDITEWDIFDFIVLNQVFTFFLLFGAIRSFKIQIIQMYLIKYISFLIFKIFQVF